MRSSLIPVALLAAAACLALAGAEPAAPRRSLAFDPIPTGARSDWDWCWESLLTLVLCKHDLLASFLAGRPAPRACCVAADEAGHHCGPLTRAFIVGSLLPHGPLAQCALPEATGSPATWPDARVRAPPRPPLKSFRIPPPYPPQVSPGTRAASPKAASGTRAPAVPAGGTRRAAGARGALPVPARGNPSKPKVIPSGSAGALARRAPDAYGAGAGAPLAAAAATR
ncbi:translation initiation factor IF-2-like [Panicum miliaceum]|uniref:Translation initiation factor IF-2-like n=1 Tax=Panicum miliaceum TaxID=4540 RepID=A0A3L6PVB6_PANMI|nr:translation initiation factor IF-2-like [Panicum miliaceum]